MANKRMFNYSFISDDKFLDMPLTAQAVYFHLGMRADDDGFVDSPKKILREVGGREDDINVLRAKGFIYSFEDGIIVILDWKAHNTIKNDRYKETRYIEHKKCLIPDASGRYSLREKAIGNALESNWNHNGTTMEPQIRLGKSSFRLEEDRIKEINKKTKESKENVGGQMATKCQPNDNQEDWEREGNARALSIEELIERGILPPEKTPREEIDWDDDDEPF